MTNCDPHIPHIIRLTTGKPTTTKSELTHLENGRAPVALTIIICTRQRVEDDKEHCEQVSKDNAWLNSQPGLDISGGRHTDESLPPCQPERDERTSGEVR